MKKTAKSMAGSIRLINNDCLVAIKNLNDNSVDAIITDPPY
jgi:DNA modification methylase